MHKSISYLSMLGLALGVVFLAGNRAVSSGQTGALVRLQPSSPGTPQSGHFNINGVGNVRNLQALEPNFASGVTGYSNGTNSSSTHPGGYWWPAGGEFAGPNGLIAATGSSGGIAILGLSSQPNSYAGAFLNDATTGGTGVYITSTRVFHVENNFIRTNPSATSAVTFSRTGNYGGAPSTVINNTFYKHVAQAAVAVSNSGPLSPLVLKNNILVGFNDGVSSPTAANWPSLSSDHNVQTSASSIDVSTGQPLNVSLLLINAGDPDPRYLDLDLTTNDVGCYGGSNSRANFTTGMGSAVVGFMQAPRVVSQGDAVNISATGFDR